MTIESDPQDAYKLTSAADLLLFRNKNNKALRLEVPGLALEFTDGLYIGRDPPGSLYYDNTNDFNKKQDGKDVTHSYTVTEYTSNDRVYIIVKFSHDKKANYALFKARDARDALKSSDMKNHHGTGEWKELINSNTPATLTKTKGQNEIKLTLPSIGQVAKWTDANKSFKDDEIKDLKGSANFKDIKALKDGIWASCNADRVVFYKRDLDSRDLIAWFLPLDSSKNIPTDTEAVFSGVSWKAT